MRGSGENYRKHSFDKLMCRVFLTCQQLRLSGLDGGGMGDNLGVCTSMLYRKGYSILGGDVFFSFFRCDMLTSVFIFLLGLGFACLLAELLGRSSFIIHYLPLPLLLLYCGTTTTIFPTCFFSFLLHSHPRREGRKNWKWELLLAFY